MSALITGQLTNEPKSYPVNIYNTMFLLYILVKMHLVKYLTQRVCLKHCSISNCDPNLLFSVAKT